MVGESVVRVIAFRWRLVLAFRFIALPKSQGVGECQAQTKGQLLTHETHHKFNHVQALREGISFKRGDGQAQRADGGVFGWVGAVATFHFRAQFERYMPFSATPISPTGTLTPGRKPVLI